MTHEGVDAADHGKKPEGNAPPREPGHGRESDSSRALPTRDAFPEHGIRSVTPQRGTVNAARQPPERDDSRVLSGRMAVHYGDSKDVDLFQLAKLFAEGGQSDAAADLTRLGEVVRGSTRIAWASEHQRLVGFASALTDGAFTGFVSHVVVHADCQGRGVEAALVDRLLKGQKGVTFTLRATTATAPFCVSLGFKASDGLCYTRAGGQGSV